MIRMLVVGVGDGGSYESLTPKLRINHMILLYFFQCSYVVDVNLGDVNHEALYRCYANFENVLDEKENVENKS